MKKGMKIALWAAVGCIFIGGILMGIGSAAGGQHQLKEVNANSMGVTFGGIGLNIGSLNENGFYRGEDETKEQEVLSGDFSRSFSADGLKKLTITVGVHELEMTEADANEVTVEGKNCDKIQCFVKNGELVLKDVGKKSSDLVSQNRKIKLIVPQGICWTEVDVDAEMAAVSIDYLEAVEAELTTGMGAVKVGKFDIQDLDINADMGSVEVSGSLGRSMDVDANMGAVNIVLAQKKTDFNYEIETSMGSVELDGESFNKVDQEIFINNNSRNTCELDASMGSIEISFE